MAETTPGVALFQQSHARLLQHFLELERQQLPSDVIDRQLMDVAQGIIQDHNTTAVIAGEPRLTAEEEQEFRSSVRGLMGGGALVPLLEREDVENIHVLGHDKVILSLANGERIMAPPLASSEEELVMMVRHLAATAGHTSRRFDTAAPILDLRLASGHRLFAVTAVAERTSMVIRRHRMLTSSLDRLEELGTITPQMKPVLRAAVRPPAPANMLVVGGTGAGKTTLLRGLLSEVPQSDLVVTIEDTLELHLRSSGLHERTLALETRTSNTEGTGEITMYDLCKAALRMSPDRVIVGEVRGGEVMQLLQSMGIGNDGSIGTIHAGNTKAAINKMLIYAQRSPDSPTPDSVLREIAQVLHLLVYIKKLPDGRRAVTSILEITGFANGEVQTSEVFAPSPNGEGVYARRFDPDGEALARLKAAGFDPDELGEPVPVETGEPQAGPRPPLPGPHPQPGPVPSHSQPPRHPDHPQPTHARPAPSPPTPPGPRPGVAPGTRRPPAPVPQGQGLPGQPPPRGVSPKRPAPVHPQQAHARQAPAAGTNGTGDRPQAEPAQGQRRPSRPGSPP
ncbi:MAG: ATPase, T2SS/T4P/T4SS family [Acidimicrobiaceae bacterium]|nr:ATPase, T2SS/T4P/T4SS family [Acidimicrobiaceae bacterium]